MGPLKKSTVQFGISISVLSCLKLPCQQFRLQFSAGRGAATHRLSTGRVYAEAVVAFPAKRKATAGAPVVYIFIRDEVHGDGRSIARALPLGV